MAFKNFLPNKRVKPVETEKTRVTRNPSPSGFTNRRQMNTPTEPQSGYLLSPGQRIGLAIIILVTMLLLLYSWQSWQMTHLNSKLIEEKEQVEKLKEEKMILQFKVNQAFSLKRVERLAKDLGMIEPEEIRWIRLTQDN